MTQLPSQPDWDGTAYHRLSNPQFSWGQRVLAQIDLHGDETVIDAGCGSGRLTAELLERLPQGHVIALDQSESMLEAARTTLLPRYEGRVTLLQADLLALTLDGVADGVFSTATFHWVPDHPLLYRNLYRALKPGGWLIAQCGGQGNLAVIRQRADALAAVPPYAPFFADWEGSWQVYDDDATTARYLLANGFVDVVTSLEPMPTTFADASEYGAFLLDVVLRLHAVRLMDATLKQQFIATLAEQAAHDIPPFTLDYVRLNMRAHRPT